MGLDISCSCRTVSFRAGSYSGFHEWRKILAKLVDVDLEGMQGFYGSKPWTKKERFYYLLNHSDCDGTLPYKECKRLIEDFDWLSKKLNSPKTINDVWNKIFGKEDVDEWWLETFEEWHNAVRHAVNYKCKLIFC